MKNKIFLEHVVLVGASVVLIIASIFYLTMTKNDNAATVDHVSPKILLNSDEKEISKDVK